MRLNETTSIGNHIGVTDKSLSGAVTVKNGNVKNSYGVAVRKDGFWGSTAGIEHSQTTTISTDVQGVCVTKTTFKEDIRVPICPFGKLGIVEQKVITCPDKVTVTNYTGYNSRGAVCTAAVATTAVVAAPIVITAVGEVAVGTIVASTAVPVLVNN